MLDDDDGNQIQRDASVREEAEWSRREGVRLRTSAASAQTTEQAGTPSMSSNSFVVVGNSLGTASLL